MNRRTATWNLFVKWNHTEILNKESITASKKKSNNYSTRLSPKRPKIAILNNRIQNGRRIAEKVHFF